MVPCGFLDEAGSMIEMLGWNCFRGWWKSNTPRETMVSHWIHLFWVTPGWIVLQYTLIFCYKWARRSYENAGDTLYHVVPLPGWFGIAPQVVNSWGWFSMDPTWCTVPSVLNLVLRWCAPVVSVGLSVGYSWIVNPSYCKLHISHKDP